MSAVVLDESGALGLQEILLPEAGPGEVRVRLAAAGVCHSDLSIVNGTLRTPMPVVLGHEGAGVIEAVGEGVTHVAQGDEVVLNWSPACRECWHCTHGEPFLCPIPAARSGVAYATLADGSPVHPGLATGAFAEQTVIPASAAIPLPEGLPLRTAAVVGCAVLTGVGAVMNTAKVQPGQSVVVVGLGGVGLSVVQGARIAGAETIIGIDTTEAKEPLARAAGATHFFTPGDGLARTVREATGGRGADHAFEVVGTGATIKLAWSLTRRGGEVTIVGIGGRDSELSFNALELWHWARTIRPSFYGSSDPDVDVPKIAAYVRSGELDLDSLISDEIGLADVPEAFERMKAGQGARSLVLFG